MTPAEHRAEAETELRRAGEVEYGSSEERYHLTAAQVHATLALAPAPPAPAQPQHKWSLDKPHTFPDATGGQVTVLPVKGAPGVILSFADDAALLENPDVLRTLASLLTAHADRLESRP